MEEKIKEILAETGAVLSGHFLLSSGKHSGGYVQCAKVLRFPDKAEVILKPVAEKLKEMQIDKSAFTPDLKLTVESCIMQAKQCLGNYKMAGAFRLLQQIKAKIEDNK